MNNTILKAKNRHLKLIELYDEAVDSGLYDSTHRSDRRIQVIDLRDRFLSRVDSILKTQYLIPRALVAPSNINDFRQFMYNIGIFGTHANIKKITTVSYAYHWMGNKLFTTPYIRFDITEDEFNILLCHLDMSGNPKYENMGNVFNGDDFEVPEWDSFPATFIKYNIATVHYSPFSPSDTGNSEKFDKYLDNVFTRLNTENKIYQSDINNVVTMLDQLVRYYGENAFKNIELDTCDRMQFLMKLTKHAETLIDRIELYLQE